MGHVYTPDKDDLRKVERDILIPKKMREIAKARCEDYVKEFENCCRGRTVSMVFMCRAQNTAMISCLDREFHDEGLRERCTREYLEKRKKFRDSEEYKKSFQKQNSDE